MADPTDGRRATLPLFDLGAVIEGVQVRSVRWLVAAVRRRGGDIVIARARVAPLEAGAGAVPLVRGIVTQLRRWYPPVSAMDWAAAVLEADEAGGTVPSEIPPGKRISLASVAWRVVWAGAMLTVAQLGAGGLLALVHVDGSVDALPLPAATALVLSGITLMYLWLIGRSTTVRRVFAYNAAAFQVYALHEDGAALSVDAARGRSPLHPWSSANFIGIALLLLPAAFCAAAAPLRALEAPPLVRRAALVVAEIAALPVVHVLAHEIQRIAVLLHRARRLRVAGPALAPLQRLVTVAPDDDELEVAVAAVREAERLEAGAEG
jgi:uncharacterized protein YqhQ